MKFYVGDYTKGLNLGGPGVCECEVTAEGELRFVQSADTLVEDPTYMILSADQNTLFVTCSTPADDEPGCSVATFDVSDGGIHLTSIHPTAGSSACHLTLSPDERFLYVANYGDGKLTVFPVENGRVGKRIQLIQHEGHGPNPKRQERPHIHFTQFHPQDGRLYVVDLGIDAVMIYRQDPQTGLLTADERVDVPAGMGPRHLAFRDDMMYVAHELGGAVSAFRSTAGGWKLEQTVPTLMEGCGSEGAVAAIRVFDDRLYVSNRQNDSIAEFEIRMGGSLALERTFSTFGSFPRDFVVLDMGLLLVANQNSGDIRLIAAPPLESPAMRRAREHEAAKHAGGMHLFLNPEYEEWFVRAIFGGQTEEASYNDVYQLGEALPLPGAVCVCPRK